MSRVLVTGGGGFIGRHVVAGLALGEHEIHVTGRSDARSSGTIWHRVDLLDEEATEALLSELRPEVLVHLAWYTRPQDYRCSPRNLDWTEASIRLIRLFAAFGGKKFIGAGSCAEYDSNFGYCSEATTPSRPDSLYGVCKNAVSQVAASASDELGIDTGWARIFFPYGYGEPSSKLVSYVVHRLLRGLPAECTTGDQFRDYVHVSDIARFFVEMVDSDARGTFNVGSGVPVTVAEIALTIGRILAAPGLVRLGARETPPDDAPMLVADIRKARTELGWAPSVGLEDGLRGTIEALKAEGAD